MANYTPSLRSNAFRVKDRETFARWIEEGLETEIEIDFIQDEPDQVVIYGYSDVPSFDVNGEEIDFYQVLASHMPANEMAIIFAIGNEKLRYLVGFATAIHSSGETVEVSLHDIYREAQEAFIGCDIREAW